MALVPMIASAQGQYYDEEYYAFYTCYEGSEYEGIENEAYLGKCIFPSEGMVVVPESVTLDGKVFTVIIIDENAFQFCSLSDIVILDGVRRIDEDAFRSCTNLKTVYIGKNIQYIGEDAFKGCNALTDLTILAETPPVVSSYDPIPESVRSQVTLHVPTAALANYQSDPFWGTFKAYDDNVSIPTAIATLRSETNGKAATAYDLLGRKVDNARYKGVIIRKENGKVRKVINR